MSPPRVGIHLTVVVWLLLAACPLLVSEWRLSQLAQITSYGIFAMSLAFLWGQTGLLCFGQAIFFGVGAYVMALITKGMVSGVGDSTVIGLLAATLLAALVALAAGLLVFRGRGLSGAYFRSEEHTSELQSQSNLVCRLLLEKKKKKEKKNRRSAI